MGDVQNDQPAASGEPAAPAPAKSALREWTESIIWALVLALIIRTLVVQAFKIPSGSMEDTLLVGDHLLVNKFIYGTKIPGLGKRVLTLREPQRGDVIVFEFPEDTGNPQLHFWQKRDFIKRIVGLPGDTVQVVNKQLLVNGKPAVYPQAVHKDSFTIVSCPQGTDPKSPCWRDNFGPVTVPADSYFAMGDNRDRSHDSRFWGFVPRDNIKGEAFILYWSRDPDGTGIRWRRLGNLIH